MNKLLRYAGVAGMVAVFISVVYSVFSLVYISKLSIQPFWSIHIFMVLLLLVSSLIFYNGFRLLGIYFNERKLVIIAWLGFLLILFETIYAIFGSKVPAQHIPGSAMLIYVVLGLISIPIGIIFLKMSSKLGSIATTIGKLNIATGIATASVIFIPIGLILSIISIVYESLLLLKQSSLINNTEVQANRTGKRKS